MTAEDVADALLALGDPDELPKVRKRLPPDEAAFGMRMRDLFDVSERHAELSLEEIDRLLDHPAYEPRMAAMCILDFSVRRPLAEPERRARFDLYLRRHDRITTWDMVDRAAPRVVGGYLAGRTAEPLERLAGSTHVLERRTAVTAPLYFVRYGSDDDVTAGFGIAGLLAGDPDPAVTNAVGIFIKHAGIRDPGAQQQWLERHAIKLPRAALRLAVEKLDPGLRTRYLG